jgi:hypothetical protein
LVFLLSVGKPKIQPWFVATYPVESPAVMILNRIFSEY